MADVVLVFSSVTTAEYLVAGIPSAARAAREIGLAAAEGKGAKKLQIAIAGGWSPSPWCRAELDRLAGSLNFDFVDIDSVSARPGTIYICGEALVQSGPMNAPLRQVGSETVAQALDPRPLAVCLSGLKQAGNALIAATGKPSDGIVSRHFNRPISRAISRFLLRFPGITPFHATLGTAALGLAMAVSLFFGGEKGLIAGALLFQAASIFDGVDGEIARATFRTSAAGAMLDSVIDAITNLAFIAGLSVNLWLDGQKQAASLGAAGLVMLATGLFLIGRRARATDGPFTFDAIKNHFKTRKSRIMQLLTWLAMRDFFAAAGALMIMAGLANHALMVFAVVTAGWLAVTLFVLLRTSGTGATI